MNRILAASVALAAFGLATSAVDAQPAPHHYAIAHNLIVRLPPGPCVNAGGRVDRAQGHDRCVVPLAAYEPPDPCLRDHGVMVQTMSGHPVCALRDPQSGLPTGKRMH